LQGLNEPTQAVTLADTGLDFLDLIIDIPGGRQTRRLIKAMRPEPAARAAVFLTHGMAANMIQLSEGQENHHVNPECHHRVRALLGRYFAWSDEEEALQARRVRLIEPETTGGLEQAQMRLAFDALTILLGAAADSQLLRPTDARLDGIDGPELEDWIYLASIPAATRYLQLSDPEGFAIWRQHLAELQPRLQPNGA
jgi:hypothetical protein